MMRWCAVMALFLLWTVGAHAVKEFKTSAYGNGVQIWFEAEAYDERIPDTPMFFPITGEAGAAKVPAGAFGEAMTRGSAGGRVAWTFDISAAGGKGGTWYFFGRVINPANQSDYMLVLNDPGDKKIPDVEPFPQGDAVPPFDNATDRVFEQDTPAWGWAIQGHNEGHTKTLQDGENTMYMFHRQGNNTRFVDVILWTDDASYFPTDADYTNATEGRTRAVDASGKLSTAWGRIKARP
ncbi:MAG: hypothetical protein O3A46_15895 [Candidatus Poribacteria bacterium]|nr:hypothetical protein [Candidatus Poribacteria bacterium]